MKIGSGFRSRSGLSAWRAWGLSLAAAAGATAVLAAGPTARASSVTTINFEANSAASAEGLGLFTGSMSYDSDAHTLAISLTNTSPIANGGYITGFAFNVANAPDDLSFLPTPKDFAPTGYVDAGKFGTYEYGFALGGDWMGGGKPQPGIGVGDTRVFDFTLSSVSDDAALDSLTASSFFTGYTGSTTQKKGKNKLLSGPKNDDVYGLGVRFKGFEKGSDKVPGMLFSPPPPTMVPVPNSVYLALVGGMVLLGGGYLRRRRTAE